MNKKQMSKLRVNDFLLHNNQVWYIKNIVFHNTNNSPTSEQIVDFFQKLESSVHRNKLDYILSNMFGSPRIHSNYELDFLRFSIPEDYQIKEFIKHNMFQDFLIINPIT